MSTISKRTYADLVAAQAEAILRLETENARRREALEEVETYFDECSAHPQFSPLEKRLLATIREALNGGPCL